MVKKKGREREGGIMPPKQLFVLTSTVIKSKPVDIGPPGSLMSVGTVGPVGGSIGPSGVQVRVSNLANKNTGHLIKYKFQINSK